MPHSVINDTCYDDLAPVEVIEDFETYDEAIVYALQNFRIKNIALTGPYGSGKSSIIKTFEKIHKEYKYLNISLASFVEKDLIGGADDELSKRNRKADQERLIELSILQQMFYKVKASQIPESRFKRINTISKSYIFFCTTLIALLILGTLAVFVPKSLNRFPWWTSFNKTYYNLIFYFFLSIILLSLYLLCKFFFKLVNSSSFKKFNISKGEIEIEARNEASILNKHLDEILYFFQETTFNVVIIEDLDRFDNPEIFTKLRELNLLINNSKQVGKRIVFIYSIKDDMFKDKTRTKFFDFIIPVIPVINATNSYELLAKKVKSFNLSAISDTFLRDISLYINDMRMLKNILNEFIIYKRNLNSIKINDDKLFALIVYKNMHPNDYALLLGDDGDVYKIFSKKNELIKLIISEKQMELDTLKKRLDDANANKVKNKNELIYVYTFAIMQRMPNATEVAIGNAPRKRFVQITGIDLDILDGPLNMIDYWSTNQHNNNVHYGNVPFKEIENLVDPDNSYQSRKRAIDDMEAGVDILKLKIEDVEREIGKTRNISISQLYKMIDNVSAFAGITENKLLTYLIREGHLDEMYTSLISYFYEGSISKQDMDFILQIKNRDHYNFEYVSEKYKELFRWLNIYEFEFPAITKF